MRLLVQEADASAIDAMRRRAWEESLQREGTVANVPGQTASDAECPACGNAAPLVDGACSDCGLQLA